MPIGSQAKLPSTNTAVAGTWTTATNIYTDTGTTYASTAPSKNGTSTLDVAGFGFDGLIPVGSTINSVTLEVRWYVSATSGTNITQGVQCWTGGVASGTEITNTSATAATTATSTTTGITTRNQLLDANFKVRVRATRANVTTSYTAYFDYVKVTVNYNYPYTQSVSAVVTPTGSLTTKRQYLQTSNIVITDGRDDVCTATAGTKQTIYPTANYVRVGDSGGGSWSGLFRFPNINVPPGSLIKTATVKVYPYQVVDTYNLGIPVTFNVNVKNEDNVVQPASYAEATNLRNVSSSTKSGTLDGTSVNTWQSYDMTSGVQTVVNRAGWVKGNALGISFDNTGTNSELYINFSSFETNPLYTAQLYLEYYSGDRPQNISGQVSPSGTLSAIAIPKPPVLSATRDSNVIHLTWS